MLCLLLQCRKILACDLLTESLDLSRLSAIIGDQGIWHILSYIKAAVPGNILFLGLSSNAVFGCHFDKSH